MGAIFTATLVGLIHIYTPLAQALSSHSQSHGKHISDASCQTLCQVTHEKQKVKTSTLKQQDREPSLKPLYLSDLAIEISGVGILSADSLWRESSWVPPDIALLSGYYSTSL